MLKMQKLEKEKLHQQINKKWVRVITVIIYVISISLVAIILGLYYRYWWQAEYAQEKNDYADVQFALSKNIINNSSLLSEHIYGHFSRLVKDIISSKKFSASSEDGVYEFKITCMVILKLF